MDPYESHDCNVGVAAPPSAFALKSPAIVCQNTGRSPISRVRSTANRTLGSDWQFESLPFVRLIASVHLGRTLARCLAEDFLAEDDSLDPALSAFGRLGFQRGGSTDRPPQAPALGVKARNQLHPTLSHNPQLLQDRRFLSRDPYGGPRGPVQTSSDGEVVECGVAGRVA